MKYSAHWTLHGEKHTAVADTMEELKAKVFGRPSAPTRDAVKFYKQEDTDNA